MKLKLADLWNWEGRMARGPFVVWGLMLAGIKYGVDRLVVGRLFQREWSLTTYLELPGPWIQDFGAAAASWKALVLLALALPFLWAGIVLCFQRLRSAGMPLWMSLLFVVPVLKWFLFAALVLAPEVASGQGRDRALLPRAGWLGWFPSSVWGSALLSVAATVALAVGAMVFGTQLLRSYGWGLFVGVPFAMGFLAALIHGAREPRTLAQSQGVALAAVGVAGMGFLLAAFEGLICLLMAAPLALILAAIGAQAGHAIQNLRVRRPPTQYYCVPVLAIPLMFSIERLDPVTPPTFSVATVLEIDAPVERVWKHVIEFNELPPPTEWIFKLGIAYPIRAEIRGHGVGAVRHCVFSTGPFVEPIKVWDEPRLLRFSVIQSPEPMQEWTPYREIHPPHLDGFLVSQEGQFSLTTLPGGRTRLEGTTRYRHSMWPAGYWQLWSDYIIHTIHLRVLRHIKRLAESEVR